MFKEVKLGNKVLNIPIIQGGMGVGISLGGLAGSVMKEDAMGVLSFAQPGYNNPNFQKRSIKSNLEAMQEEVAKARQLSEGRGLLGVNVMVESTFYKHYIKECVKLEVDAIISGAGLPLNLPELTKDSGILLAPIVSSKRALNIIMRRWEQHHEKIPDFIVIEGSEAGGHLGFKKEDILNNTCQTLEEILQECLEFVAKYEEKYERKIPIFVAGGIFTGKDIAKFIKLGASGVQMGTRFIATEESDAHENFKQAIVNCKKEDIVITKSPTGFPARAILNKFTKSLETSENVSIKKCVNCILSCNSKSTVYCITDALIKAVRGDIVDGLIFTGSNGYRVDKIMKVKDLIRELVLETKQELGVI